MKTTIAIKGTHCQSCTVNFETGATIIEHTENINWDTLKKEIEALGESTVLIPDIKLFACPECQILLLEGHIMEKPNQSTFMTHQSKMVISSIV